MSKKRAGIIGWPVSHSLSPALHTYWLKQYGIDGEYVRLAVEPKDFDATLHRARSEGFAGVNVTVPHKEAAFKLADRRDAAAEICGAANLLIFGPTGLEGRNTDHYGLHKSLAEELGPKALAGKTAILLGAGGAARGAVLALEELGASQIHILNRHQARAEALAHDLALKVQARLIPGPPSSFGAIAQSAALLVNASAGGMTGKDKLELDLAPLSPAASVCDLVYNPLETALLKDAALRGHKTIDGLGMLMHQAAPSFAAFFGQQPQVTPGLRKALIEALNAR
jgi:shikimate dehydrogenase